MNGFAAGVLIAVLGGLASVPVGERIPRERLDPGRFPFRPMAWEREGRFYERLGIRYWKDRVPDLSRFVPGMVRKKAFAAAGVEGMERLIRETCAAEAVHAALILLLSLPIALTAGVPCALLYAAGNLVFIVIQRYNRPRLIRLRERMEKRRTA